MPVLHDNRNMRPDLLNNTPETVDDIFANADAEMAQQRQRQLFSPPKRKINWRRRWKQIIIITTSLVFCFLIVAGAWGVKLAHNTMVSEVQTQVLREIRNIKANIAAKDETELTTEDLFMLEVFEILPEEDIVNIIQTATSAEEIINFLKNPSLDVSKYLTIDQKLQLEDVLNRYAEDMGTQWQEYEQQMSTESTEANADNESTQNTSETISMNE